MFLTNYDLYDLYAVFLLIRAYPADKANALAVAAVKEIVDAPQGQLGRTNAIRSCLGNIPELDREKWYFAGTENVYTYVPSVLKDEKSYAILSACLEEMQKAMRSGNTDRIYDLADALHNIPLILAEGKKDQFRAIHRMISYVYRPKWNKNFLTGLL